MVNTSLILDGDNSPLAGQTSNGRQRSSHISTLTNRDITRYKQHIPTFLFIVGGMGVESVEAVSSCLGETGMRCATIDAASPVSASAPPSRRILRRTYTYKILTLMILGAILQCSLAFSSTRLQAQQGRDGRALRRDIAALSLKMQSSADDRQQQHTWSYLNGGERTPKFDQKPLLTPKINSNHARISGPSSSTNSRTVAAVSSTTALAMGLSTSPPPYPVRVTVMGGGNFGLALASVLGRKGIPVTLLVRSEGIASELNDHHRHPRYMSDITLPTSIRATADPQTALSDATYVVHSVPVQYSRSFLEDVKEYIPKGVPVLSASKGIETTSLGFMADILRETLGDERSYAFLSGPSFAREICEGVATAVVIASEDVDLTNDCADLFSSENFRVYTSHDVIGVEVGGAVKNVIALAAGMCEGLELGTNAMSGLVTRGCAEMRRLGRSLGARPSTIAGLSGK